MNLNFSQWFDNMRFLIDDLAQLQDGDEINHKLLEIIFLLDFSHINRCIQ